MGKEGGEGSQDLRAREFRAGRIRTVHSRKGEQKGEH